MSGYGLPGTVAIRSGRGKWHRGGRWDYPGDVHCPTGLGLVLMPTRCETAPIETAAKADRCRRCFPPTTQPRTSAGSTEEATS